MATKSTTKKATKKTAKKSARKKAAAKKVTGPLTTAQLGKKFLKEYSKSHLVEFRLADRFMTELIFSPSDTSPRSEHKPMLNAQIAEREYGFNQFYPILSFEPRNQYEPLTEMQQSIRRLEFDLNTISFNSGVYTIHDRISASYWNIRLLTCIPTSKD